MKYVLTQVKGPCSYGSYAIQSDQRVSFLLSCDLSTSAFPDGSLTPLQILASSKKERRKGGILLPLRVLLAGGRDYVSSYAVVQCTSRSSLKGDWESLIQVT